VTRLTYRLRERTHIHVPHQEEDPVIKRPSFPVYRVTERTARPSVDHRLSVVALVLAIIVAAGLLVRAAGPISETPSDPDNYLVDP